MSGWALARPLDPAVTPAVLPKPLPPAHQLPPPAPCGDAPAPPGDSPAFLAVAPLASLPRAAASARRALLAAPLLALAARRAEAQGTCRGTVHLTIDTGWSREAEAIAETLRRHQVRATLFLADEPTFRGDRTLDDSWAPFWRARVAEGHNFASHTWRHWYFRGDIGPGQTRYVNRAGPGQETLDQAALCAELARPMDRLRQLAPGAQVLPLWRAPGGITTPGALAMAAACGLRHQGWTANGFWGDELDSAAHPNAALARRAIATTRPGEVVVLHWGVRSRRDPLANVLDEIIAGVQARGLCFAPLPAAGA